jgi:hypothetical protein
MRESGGLSVFYYVPRIMSPSEITEINWNRSYLDIVDICVIQIKNSKKTNWYIELEEMVLLLKPTLNSFL